MSMPPGAGEPDPYAAPSAPTPPPPPPAAPPAGPPPPGGYAVPPPTKPSYAGLVDPLVPAGSDFNSWFAKVQEVAKRSWKSALFTTGLGIAAPLAVATLIRYAGGFTSAMSVTSMGTFFSEIGSF